MNAYLQTMEERRYRAYLTDALMIITENTAKFAGGKHLTQRWVDQFKPVDNRTAEEIAAEVMKNAGLIQGGGLNDGDLLHL